MGLLVLNRPAGSFGHGMRLMMRRTSKCIKVHPNCARQPQPPPHRRRPVPTPLCLSQMLAAVGVEDFFLVSSTPLCPNMAIYSYDFHPGPQQMSLAFPPALYTLVNVDLHLALPMLQHLAPSPGLLPQAQGP